MMPLLIQSLRIAPARSRTARGRRAFSLVEVTLAMGIVTFALVAVVGVMPTAMTTGRQSFNQNRAAAIANTLFTSFRSQPFSSVGYLDNQFQEDGVRPAASSSAPRLDLNALGGTSSQVTFYAAFIDVSTDSGVQADTFGSQRRLCFTQTATALPPTAPAFQVALRFNNQPDGMMVNPSAGGATRLAQANQVEIVITPANQALQSTNAQTLATLDKYRFVSTIANREH